jgi:hypothetical protein
MIWDQKPEPDVLNLTTLHTLDELGSEGVVLFPNLRTKEVYSGITWWNDQGDVDCSHRQMGAYPFLEVANWLSGDQYRAKTSSQGIYSRKTASFLQ